MTSNGVVRIFMPVIDAPNRLQLHATIDPWSFSISGNGIDSPSGSASQADLREKGSGSDCLQTNAVFWLDRSVLTNCSEARHPSDGVASDLEEGRKRKLKDLTDDDWELFGFVTHDGSLVIRTLIVRIH